MPLYSQSISNYPDLRHTAPLAVMAYCAVGYAKHWRQLRKALCPSRYAGLLEKIVPIHTGSPLICTGVAYGR